MSDKNPLQSQGSIDQFINSAIELLLTKDQKSVITQACFKSSAQMLDDCINVVDAMLHSNPKHLTKAEYNMMMGTLNNLRAVYAHQRAMLIEKYDDGELNGA